MEIDSGSPGPAWSEAGARAVLEHCEAVNARLLAIISSAERELEPADLRAVRGQVGELIGLLFAEIKTPILDRYPHLAPEHLRDDETA